MSVKRKQTKGLTGSDGRERVDALRADAVGFTDECKE